MGAEDKVRKQAQQGALNFEGMTLEETQAAIGSSLSALAGQLMAAQGQGSDPYSQALQMFPSAIAPPGAPLQAAFSYVAPDLLTSTDGTMLKYGNGVIVDLGQQALIPGPWLNDPEVEGSPAWLASAQDEWSKSKVKSWRKRLAKMGYEVSESGGWAQDLTTALQEYHFSSYLNYGKPQPLRPTTQEARETIRKSLDRKVIAQEVAGWGDVVFGEALDEPTSEFFTDRIFEVATRLAKRHPNWSMEQVTQGAQVRVQEEFTERPAVRGELRDLEEDEMDESLRQNIVSISQLGAV